PRVKLRPWREGGTGGDSVSPTQPTDFPFFLEGGTPNVLGAAGLIAGIDFLEQRGLDAIRQHEVGLTERRRQRIVGIGYGVFGLGDPGRGVGTVSFRHAALPAPELGAVLDQAFEIAVRPGLHCAPYVHRSIASFPDGLVRVSPGLFNTVADLDR